MPGFLKPLLLALGIIIGALAALFIISRSALPDSPVYPAKTAFESAQLYLTFGNFPKARWYMTLAERRTDEGKTLARIGKDDEAVETLGKVGSLVEIAYRYAATLIDLDERDEITRRGEAARREADQASRDVTEGNKQGGEQ